MNVPTVPTGTSEKGFLKQFRDLLEDLGGCEDVDLNGSLRLQKKKVRVPSPAIPLQLLLGGEDGHRLHMYPEVVIDDKGKFRVTGDYLLFEPEKFFSDVSGFVRLGHGDAVTIGRDDKLLRLLLGLPKGVDAQHLRLKLTDKGLALRNKSKEQGACVAPLTSTKLAQRMIEWRREKVKRLAAIVESPVDSIGKSEALGLLERVIEITEQEPYREKAPYGPGGVLALPDRPRPIFVGDLHTRIDNLLVLLTQNGFIEALEDGSGLLIILGDAVHPDVEGHEADMDSSMLLMDLIFRLKIRYPDRVFYLRGNHDSFGDDVSKGGVPQGLLWEKALHDKRGLKYRNAMQRYYDLLPYIAVSPSFIACHAGPPTGKYSRDDLVSIRDNAKVLHQLTHVRLQRPNSPSGYGRGDLARLRKRFGLPADTPVVVGHTPLSPHDTLWSRAGGIDEHYVLFGANEGCIGVITRVGRHLVPLRYPSEPLVGVLNRFLRSGKGLG